MKRITIGAALAVSLLAGTSAFAQHDDRERGGAAPAPSRQPQAHAPAAPVYHAPAQPPGGYGGPRGNVGREAAPAYAPQADGRGGAPQYGHRYVPQGDGVSNDERRALAPTGEGRGYRQEGGPRYDQRAFPREFRPEHPYRWRGDGWREPRGYYSRHWGYGDRLPWGWIGPQWFIDDYYDYDLPVPPWGFEWIRVGPDALLIDLSSGMVVEAAYGLFY